MEEKKEKEKEKEEEGQGQGQRKGKGNEKGEGEGEEDTSEDKLTDEEKRLRQAFNSLDPDGTQFIELEDLRFLLRCIRT